MQTLSLYNTTGVNGYRIVRTRITRNHGKTKIVSSEKELKKASEAVAKRVDGGRSPDRRFIITIEPKGGLACSCGSKDIKVYKTRKRLIQCHPFGLLPGFVEIKVHQFYCRHCHKLHYEHLPFLTEPKAKLTRALERTVVELRRAMSISDVAKLYGLDPRCVKAAEMRALELRYRYVPLKDVRAIGIDELYVFSREKANRKYVTVVRDLDSGAVLNVSRGKGEDALKMFASRLGRLKDGPGIEYVAMDMSNAYFNFVEHSLPKAQIVFDHFHVIKAINDRLDRIRRRTIAAIKAGARRTLASETATEREKRGAEKALEKMRDFKGNRYLSLRNKDDLSEEDRSKLQALLDEHADLSKAYALKEDMRAIYSEAKDAAEATTLLTAWIAKARASKVREMVSMAETVATHLEGILGYWKFRKASNAATEGFNNKIRWLIKQAYGYRDYRYFRLKVFDLPNLKTTKSDA